MVAFPSVKDRPAFPSDDGSFASPSSARRADSSASNSALFGGARPVDTQAKEAEILSRRGHALDKSSSSGAGNGSQMPTAEEPRGQSPPPPAPASEGQPSASSSEAPTQQPV
jgi:hypothetical protein